MDRYADVVTDKDGVDFVAANTAAEEATPEPVYQDVDKGVTILTMLAVLVAILIVFLLAVILIIQFAPQGIERIIENCACGLKTVLTNTSIL